MKKEATPLHGCFVLKPTIFKDERGTFFETFNEKAFSEVANFTPEFVQENQSISKKGVLRGFHFQKGQHAQAKLVRVVRGAVQDVVVDLRKDSRTFGKYFSIILDDKNNYQLYIPKGFAHAFLCLTDGVIFSYKCDAYYHPTSESGILYKDETLNVQWELPEEALSLSEKDKTLPMFRTLFP
jgi:dTDP-4-dehydrorhamnose 3,5-epimerase